MTVGEIIAVPMPHMGVSVEEGTIVAWHKAPGDEVRADEAICDIATDKVDTEVASPADGVLARILAEAGDTVAVGDPLAELAVGDDAAAVAASRAESGGAAAVAPATENAAEPGGDDGAASIPTGTTVPSAATPSDAGEPGLDLAQRAAAGRDEHGAVDPEAAAEVAVAARPRDGKLASPVARRLADQHGVDLSAVEGSGRRGRIRKADVLAAVERGGQPPAPEVTIPQPSAPRAPAPAPEGMPPGYEGVPYELVETSRIRRVISEHMIRSRQTAAHMTTEVDVDLSVLTRARAELNAGRLAAGGRKLSFLPFIARAACSMLTEHPDLYATFQHVRAIRWKSVNLGVAVDTPDGLLVPVLRGCERLTAPAIAGAIADVAERARTRRLTPDDLAGGTFTISNPGSVGAVSAPAIINQPQVAILGIPTIQRRPWVVSDEFGAEAIGIRPILRLALTFDHRAVDGADATRALVTVKERLEAWGPEAYG